MWVKICGTTNYEDAQTGVEAGADALGFIFAPSKRRISSDSAREIVRKLPPEVGKFGIFVNEPVSSVAETVSAVGLTGIQLHGDEDEDYIVRLQRELPGRREIIKALAYGSGLVESSRRFGAIPDIWAVLVDSGAGGSGAAFDWWQAREVFHRAAEHTRLILAGGLIADSVGDAIATLQPWGVDVASGVESAPGRKDHDKVRCFIECARRPGPETQDPSPARPGGRDQDDERVGWLRKL